MKADKKKAREELDIVNVVEWRQDSDLDKRWFLLVRRPEGGASISGSSWLIYRDRVFLRCGAEGLGENFRSSRRPDGVRPHGHTPTHAEHDPAMPTRRCLRDRARQSQPILLYFSLWGV